MRLVDLDPCWVTGSQYLVDPSAPDGPPVWDHGHVPGRAVGVSFECPHCRETRIAVAFASPVDGGPPSASFKRHWQRTGDSFETLTLTPSVDASESGHWHGFIANGQAT